MDRGRTGHKAKSTNLAAVTLAAGQEVTFYGNNSAPVVGSGAKNVAMSGAGTSAVECVFIAG